jgi:nicotinate-nucleotide pyrophosphorylase (carboxylating)
MVDKRINQHIISALSEDQYQNDLTSKLSKNIEVQASIISKESFYIYGLNWMKAVFKKVDKNLKIDLKVRDGEYINNKKIIAKISGKSRSILSAERTALNYLQTMSGVYDKCIRYKKKIIHKPNIKILHTRKTIPLMRLPLSEACSAAGCNPHRYSLSDGILLKENHLRVIDNLEEFILKANKKKQKVIIEAKSPSFAKKISKLKIERILLDNFTPKQIKDYLKSYKKQKIEVSGSININNIKKYAIDGVNFISIGSLTKNIISKDISLLIE